MCHVRRAICSAPFFVDALMSKTVVKPKDVL